MPDLDRRQLIAYVAAAVVLVVVAVRWADRAGARTPPIALKPAAPAARPRAAPKASGIYVHVAGAVRRPGLITVASGSRVATAIEAAGGPLRRADLTAVNLAAKLADGQQVIVPERGQLPTPAAPVGGGSGASGSGAAGSSVPGPGAGPISLSSATQGQLETLDGIGPGLAGRILAYRTAHGGFRSIEELREVEGIGDKRFEALKARLQP